MRDIQIEHMEFSRAYLVKDNGNTVHVLEYKEHSERNWAAHAAYVWAFGYATSILRDVTRTEADRRAA